MGGQVFTMLPVLNSSNIHYLIRYIYELVNDFASFSPVSWKHSQHCLKNDGHGMERSLKSPFQIRPLPSSSLGPS